MSWPLSQDYNEAIQDPQNSFGDAELKTGEAVTNALGIPMPRSGNFADVYEVRCPNGSHWAVKCFTREVAGLRERYAEISKYLQQANLPFMVDFKYLEQGIRIRGQWYPILKMQWVQGFVLNEFVRDNLDKKSILNALGQIWLRMARRLREAKLAHCDLQHGNVLFVPGSTANSLAVKLIDYDGMCVPALLGTKSGEVGHPAFQHPERLRTGAYNQEVDRFSLLSIAAGLRCLTVGGRALWDKYDNGDNLLFRQSDLQKPAESPLFQELLAIQDPQTQALVKELYTACQSPLAGVPLLTDLLPEEKPAAKTTTTAIARPAAAAQGPDWNFGDEEASGSVVKNRRKASKMPGWVWGAIAGAAALLLVGGIVALAFRGGPKDEKRIARNQTEKQPQHSAKVPEKRISTENVPPDGAGKKDGDASPLPPTVPKGTERQSAGGLASANDLDPSKGEQARNAWLYKLSGKDGWFRRETDKSWIESTPDGRQCHFEELEATDNYVELFDRTRMMWLRLYSDRVEWRQGDNLKWYRLYSGRWVVAVKQSPKPNPPGGMAWNQTVDPDGDCKVQDADDKLTITIPAKHHVLEAVSGRANSPRRLLDIDGDFTVQVRVGGDFTPAPASSDGERFSWIGAGLILWVDDNTFLRLERAGWYGRKPSTLYANWEVRENSKWIETKHNFAGLSAAETYLRLERRGKQILPSYSEDGQNWINVKPWDIEIPAKVKIGVLAGSTTGRTFAPTFDRFQLKNGRGEMIRVDWPSMPAAEPVVVKPPLPSEPVPTPMRPKLRRQPVPDPAAVEAALKDIRGSHKAEYGNGNRIQLQIVLFKDLNGARNDPPRHFALLREIRDVCAETNVRSGLGQAQSMAQYFDVNMLAMKCEALERSLRSVHPSAADLVVVGLPLLDRAIGEENYDALGRLLKIIEPAAAQLPANDGNRLMAGSVVAQAKQVKKDHTALQAERRTLENDPDDAKANLALGKFHCASRGDWGDGLPQLARGSDAALAALAEKDLANPDDAAAQIALANAWRKQAGVVNSKSLQLACYKRAYSWYQQAALQLKGEKLKEVQKALTSLAKIPTLQNPWWQFGIYGGIKLDTAPDYLGIRPGNNMTMRECYRGPIDITVVARSMTTDLNVGIGAGGRLIVGQDFFTKRDRIQVFRPDAAPALMGSRAIEKDVVLPANRPFTVRWQVAPVRMKVWFEDELVFEETRSYDLSEKYEVMIHGNSKPIEVKTVTVRRGPQK